MHLSEHLHSIAAKLDGTMGLAVHVPRMGDQFLIHADELFPLASVFKVPLMVEAFRQAEAGRFHLDDLVEITAADLAPGSGLLQELRPGARLSVHNLVTLATIISDNTAADILFRLVGGGNNITARMQALGLRSTAVPYDCKALIAMFVGLDPADRSPAAVAEMKARALREDLEPDPRALLETLENNCATPADIMRLFTLLERRELVSPAASEEMLQILLRQQLNQRIPQLLPGGTKVAHKTGTLGPTRNDAGIIYLPNGDPIIFCAFTKRTNPQKGPEVDLIIAEAALAVYNAYAS